MACASNHKKIQTSTYILEPRPEKMPKLQDGSPEPCPECEAIDGQPMLKFTVRDFVADKKKHIEKDDYIDYLQELLRSN